MSTKIQLVVAGLVQEPAPVVLLQDKAGKRCIPIWVGDSEAFLLGTAMLGKQFERPLTHDLLCSTIRNLDASIKEVSIDKVENETFHASILLDTRFGESRIDARASDAIILALKAGVQIQCPEDLFRSVSVVADKPERTDKNKLHLFNGLSSWPASVKHISADDWEELLELAEPSDFKYEM